jgi:hypothetical protein
MQAIIMILIFILPAMAHAGTGNKPGGNEKKSEKIDIRISTDKNGKVEITGLDNKELVKLEKEINKALKNVTIKIDDGKEKHEVHFEAEIKIK